MSACSHKLTQYLCNPKIKSNRLLSKELKQVIIDLKLVESFDATGMEFERAHYLVAHPDVRMVIEVFLMTPMSLEDISVLLKYKFQLDVPANVLYVFRKYFYNPRIMDGASWRNYMSRRLSVECQLKNMALKDPYDIPRLKWKMGFQVDIPYVEQARKLMTDSYFNLSELVNARVKNTEELMAMKSMWQTAGDRFAKLNVDDAEAEANLAALSLKARDTRKELEAPKMITGPLPEIKKDPNKSKVLNMQVDKGKSGAKTAAEE